MEENITIDRQFHKSMQTNEAAEFNTTEFTTEVKTTELETIKLETREHETTKLNTKELKKPSTTHKHFFKSSKFRKSSIFIALILIVSLNLLQTVQADTSTSNSPRDERLYRHIKKANGLQQGSRITTHKFSKKNKQFQQCFIEIKPKTTIENNAYKCRHIVSRHKYTSNSKQ